MIGVDLGGTRIKAGVVLGGELTESLAVDTRPDLGATWVMNSIAKAVSDLENKPAAVGLAVPGVVNPDGLCCRMPNIPSLEGVNLREELQKRLNCRVTVENDATTAAWAERHLGHGKRFLSFLMVTLGTGIGGGLVMDGQLRRGRCGFAGEIGHTPIHRGEQGWPCSCGLRGCLESYAGTRGLLRKYTELGGCADEIQPIAIAARNGEQIALLTFQALGVALGIGLAGIQNTLDLEAVVFTGGISSSFDLIESSLRESLRKYAFADALAQVPLLTSDLGANAGLLGAAYLTTL